MPRPLDPVTAPTGDAAAAVAARLVAALAGSGPALGALPSGPPALRAALLARYDPARPVRDDTALVLPTSGSTGTPKAVELSAAALRASAAATHAALGGPGRWVLALPLTHVAGWMVLVRAAAAGVPATVVDLAGGFDPAALAAAAEGGADGLPRYVSLVPPQLSAALDAGVDLSAYATVLLGGAAPAAALLERARAAGVRVVTTYGMTETCGGCVYDGRALPGVGVALRPDGRVVLSGPTLFSGYRGDPAATQDALRDATLVTRDLGRLAADGRLELVGRADDTIISAGVTVATAAVEAALASHPGVADVAVLGVPDPVWGERVVAVVAPAAGASPTPAALRAHAAGALEPAALPRHVLLVDALPLLGSGKPDRAALARLVAETPPPAAG